jgi:hypothetical protein
MGIRLVSFSQLIQFANFNGSGFGSAFQAAQSQFFCSVSDALGSTEIVGNLTPNFINVFSTRPNFKGFQYGSDYSENFEPRSLIDLSVLKSRLWNSNIDPTATNDTIEGFVSGRSFWLNTTTGVLWRCLDASTGAAVWEVYYDPNAFTRLINTTDTAAVTGVATEQRVRTVLIPANTFSVGDIARIRVRARKTGVAGSGTLRIRINTNPTPATITAVPLAATYITAANNNLFWQTKREVVIKSATVTEVTNAASTANNDDAAYAQAVTNLNIDWAVDQYIHFTLQNSAVGDSSVISFTSIDKDSNI